jgi:outer membrane lipoprotein-sorting protein
MIRHITMILLLWLSLLVAVPAWGKDDPLLAEMTEKFNVLTNYTTLLDSEGEGERSKIFYSYKKPGFIRMDFIQPHKGATLIYNPTTNTVTLRPFSEWSFKFNLDPENRLITDSKGHTVDQSDIGALIRSIVVSAHEGSVTHLPPETHENLICPRLRVEGAKTTYLLWIHPELRLPIKVVKLFPNGEKEMVFLRKLAVNVSLDDALFLP